MEVVVVVVMATGEGWVHKVIEIWDSSGPNIHDLTMSSELPVQVEKGKPFSDELHAEAEAVAVPVFQDLSKADCWLPLSGS